MEAVAIIGAIVSASAQIQQAEQQASSMRLQAQQAELQGRQHKKDKVKPGAYTSIVSVKPISFMRYISIKTPFLKKNGSKY